MCGQSFQGWKMHYWWSFPPTFKRRLGHTAWKGLICQGVCKLPQCWLKLPVGCNDCHGLWCRCHHQWWSCVESILLPCHGKQQPYGMSPQWLVRISAFCCSKIYCLTAVCSGGACSCPTGCHHQSGSWPVALFLLAQRIWFEIKQLYLWI